MIHWALSLSLSLLIIIICINRKLNLGLTMLLSGTILVVLVAKPALLPEAIYATVTNRSTQILFAGIVAIEALGYLLKQTGSLQNMITVMGRLVKDIRLLTATLPALIGILTVPGGVVLSAPLVEQMGSQIGMPPERQAAANMWFRHAFYFAYPLFPSIVLASELAGINVIKITAYNLSLTVTGLLIAYLVIFRGLPGKAVNQEAAAGPVGMPKKFWRDLTALGGSLAPLITVLVLVIFFEILFPLALAAGLIVALFNGIPWKKGFAGTLSHRFTKILIPGITFKLALTVLGVMYFKQVLEFTGITVNLAEALIEAGLPLLLLMFVFPALIGLLTGDNAATVAIVFPLFLPLLATGTAFYPAQVAFLCFSSAWGHLFTPTHPCFTLNNAYYKVSVTQVLRNLLLPGAAVFILGWLQIFLARIIFL
ncbi:MAG: DUF401 family protein [Bacillota bacterium]